MSDTEYIPEELEAMKALEKLANKYIELRDFQSSRSTWSHHDLVRARAYVRTEARRRNAEKNDAKS